ncbi:MAG: fatty acid desaturase [Spirochaetes bacterium]|nr:fatty acid desaturase [Spirochaetota bacterium]
MQTGVYGYSAETVEAFGREIEELYRRTKAKVGHEDLKIMADLDRYSQLFDRAGRALIHFSPGPLSFTAGVGLLAAHFVMEFTNGHNILHGHYDDIPGNGHINSRDFRWDNTMDETDWKFEHHVCHHPFTNIEGKDHDFGYLLFRMNPQQEWQPRHLVQMAAFFGLPAIMTYYMPGYISTARALFEKRDVATLRTYGPTLLSLAQTLGRDYLLFPLLAGPLFPKVFLGNMLARILAGGHLMYMLVFEHHGADIPLVDEPENESKYEFYLRQTLTSRNYQVWEWYEHLLMGSINTHLEHHLFPDLPFNRLKEIAPEVESICKKYGVPYRRSTVFEAFSDVVGAAVRNSLPLRPGESALSLLANPGELVARVLTGAKNSWLPLLTGETGAFTRTCVIKTEKLSPDVMAVTFKNPWPDFRMKPGQYISVQHESAGKLFTRQYSITHFSRESISIAVRKIAGGQVSPQMHALKAGSELRLVGKIKGSFTLEAAHNSILFVAGGVGITPILAMIHALDAGQSAVLLYFNRSAEHILFKDELAEAEKSGRIKVLHILDDAPEGRGRYSYATLLQHVPDALSRSVYACAPQPLLERLEADLVEHGFNPQRYHTEKFAAKELPQLPKSGVTHTIRFLNSGSEFVCDENETLLSAIERAKIVIPTGCRAGMCKACTVQLEKGGTDKTEPGQRGLITTCNAYPRSDIELWV